MACSKVCGASEPNGQDMSASGLSHEGLSREVALPRTHLVYPACNKLAQTHEGVGAN